MTLSSEALYGMTTTRRGLKVMVKGQGQLLPIFHVPLNAFSALMLLVGCQEGHPFFTGWMPFLPPNQQRQSAEGPN